MLYVLRFMFYAIVMRYIVGIDEAGRGPLAGPVCVATVAIPERIYKSVMFEFRGVKDSKKISGIVRDKWLKKIKNHKSKSILSSSSLVGNATIDKKGIVRAVSIALSRSLLKLGIKPLKSKVLLDGSLKAPGVYKYQKTIIRGDEKEKIIAMASIVAKVHRDRHMIRKSKKYPKYGFEIHKGYGTKRHIKKIKEHGLSDIHRRSFLRSLKF